MAQDQMNDQILNVCCTSPHNLRLHIGSTSNPTDVMQAVVGALAKNSKQLFQTAIDNYQQNFNTFCISKDTYFYMSHYGLYS